MQPARALVLALGLALGPTAGLPALAQAASLSDPAMPSADWVGLRQPAELQRRCEQALAGWRQAAQAFWQRRATPEAGVLDAQPPTAPPPAARLAATRPPGTALPAGLQAADPQAAARALLDGLDRLARLQEDSLAPLAFLAQVHPQAGLRRAASACELRSQAAQQRFWQQPRLLAALQALQPADPVDAQHRDEALRQAREAGAGLPPADRPAFAQRRLRLARLALDFERHLDEEALSLDLPTAAWRGLPPDWVRAQPAAGPGVRRLVLDPPRAERFLREAEDRPARAAAWARWHRSGGPANLQRLREVLSLRRAQARALGAPSPAAQILAGRMAARPDQAAAFLDRLDAALAPREAQELEALAPWLPEAGGPAGLRRWDLAHAEARAQRAQAPAAAVPLALPAEAALALAFEALGQGFGLRFSPRAQALWHPEARAWDVAEADGRPLGRLYTDLHPRPGKHGHFAVFPLRNAGEGRRAAMALLANLPHEGLGVPELESLFHELGHALQMLLAQPRRLAGAAFAQPWDAVEALPLWLESWARRPEVLALLPQACPACPPPAPQALQALQQAPQRLRATRLRRQLQYARYDLELHGPQPQDPLALWQRLEAGHRLGAPAGDLFPASFRHLVGGYEAGYYGYLWSQALAAELDTLAPASVLDPALGRHLRQAWLVHGHDQPAPALWRQLLGRPWTETALLNSLQPPAPARPAMVQSAAPAPRATR